MSWTDFTFDCGLYAVAHLNVPSITSASVYATSDNRMHERIVTFNTDAANSSSGCYDLDSSTDPHLHELASGPLFPVTPHLAHANGSI